MRYYYFITSLVRCYDTILQKKTFSLKRNKLLL